MYTGPTMDARPMAIPWERSRRDAGQPKPRERAEAARRVRTMMARPSISCRGVIATPIFSAAMANTRSDAIIADRLRKRAGGARA